MGSSWELLGVSWGLSGASRSTKRGLQIRPGTPLGLVRPLLAAEDGRESLLGQSLASFWCSWGPLGGILVSVKPILTIKTDLLSFDNLLLSYV